MTRYSRSVIPGRSNGNASGDGDLDRMIFGQKGRDPSGDEAGDDEADEAPPPRAQVKREGARRKPSRRKPEFAPLPGEGKRYRAPEDNKRGAALLMGAVAIVAVFGIVVWNAYREGVRPQDSDTAPLLATSGAFKSKPDVVETTSAAEQASVFEQVEPPRPAVSPAPETRPEPPPVELAAAPSAAAPVTKPVETKGSPAPAASKPVETKMVETKLAETKPAEPRPIQVAAPAAPKASAPISLTPKPAVAAAPLSGAFKPAFAAGGKFAVQIAAVGAESAAIAEWNRQAKASPELFSAAERFTVQAEVNGKTVYRLRAGSFATSADADAFCSAFKAKGGQCYRVSK